MNKKKIIITCTVPLIDENGRKLSLEMNAEDVVELINSPDPELTIDELTELKKKITVEEIDDFELRGKIMTVAKLTEGLNLIEFLKVLIQTSKV